MRSYDPTFPLFPVLAFIGFVISLIPLPWHAQAWNSGTCAFMIWTSTMCLIYFINSLIWAGNLSNIAPVWCDITSKLMIGASAGFPASILCISRRLYHITAVQTVSVTRRDKLRMVSVDLCISLGIPVLVMILHVVVQGHRFDIFEDFGCFAVTYNTLPAYFLVDMWPILLASISFVYSSLTLRSFWARRAQFHDLAASNSALSMSRYIRLMLLALLDIMLTLPLSVFTFYMGTKGHVQPWISWEDTHYDFGRVGKFASIVWMGNPNTRVPVEMTRWLPVLCAYVFFALFGFASEAQKHYARVFNAALKLVGYKRSPIAKKAPLPSWVKPFKSNPHASVGSLPVYAPHTPEKKDISSLSSLDFDRYSTADTENSAGLNTTISTTAPPEYDISPLTDVFSSSFSTVATPPSSVPPTPSTAPQLTYEPCTTSLFATISGDRRIYITPEPASETPNSPAPFSDFTIPMFHRPFTPPNAYPVTTPYAGSQGLTSGIHVMIQTHSESTDSL